MTITDAKRREFGEAAKPLMEWLRLNCNPHTKVIVDSQVAELVEGVTTANRRNWVQITGDTVHDGVDAGGTGGR